MRALDDRSRRLHGAAALTTLALALCACGGGGGDAGTPRATGVTGVTGVTGSSTTTAHPLAAATDHGTSGVDAATGSGMGRVDATPAPAVAPAATLPPATPPVRTPLRPVATLLLHIDGPDAGVSHDVLSVAGTADLDGTLRLEFGDDYTPAAGQRYTVVTAAKGITGQFLTVTNNKSLPLVLSRDDQHVVVTVGN